MNGGCEDDGRVLRGKQHAAKWKSFHQDFVKKFNLSPAEASATETLLHLDPAVTEKLSKAAATYGMWRGPFSHNALGSACWRHDYVLQSDDDWWMSQFTDQHPDLRQTLAERLVGDWARTPAGLRKTADSEKVMELFKICTIHSIYVGELQRQVGQELTFHDVESIETAFMLGSFDDRYKQDATDHPVLDITVAPEYSTIVARHRVELQYAEVERRKELKLQVEGATYNKLCQDMNDDMTLVQRFWAKWCILFSFACY